MIDTISKREVLDKFQKICDSCGEYEKHNGVMCGTCYLDGAKSFVEDMPSAQTEPLSDAYMKAVWTWLLDYQIKVAELKGRYTPYEVLSWVANDWRKEYERFNQQTGVM